MTNPSRDAGQAAHNDDVILDTHQKALAVNLDPTSFGSFAEIGAGQEVARWFLRVGGASGTVAKTISAYDKEVSDDLYGSGTRYVSRERLEAMLEKEWSVLLQQVGKAREATTRLFAFADTVAARNFAGTNDCHGWLGLRFQASPGIEPSQVVLHVNLRDGANLAQQEAVGVLGVNLVHAVLTTLGPAAPPALIARLFDGLADGRIEIDQLVMQGGAFPAGDTAPLHAGLARDGRAEAVTLSPDGEAIAANELLYRRAVVLVPTASGAGRELSSASVAACEASVQREVTGNAEVKGVLRMNLVVVGADAPDLSPRLGTRAALLTRHEPLFRATSFVRRYTRAPLRFAISAAALARIFDESSYEKLEGRLLEGVARLFGDDVRVMVCPSRREVMLGLLASGSGLGWEIEGDGAWVTAEQMRPAAPMRHLLDYLIGTGFLVSIPPA